MRRILRPVLLVLVLATTALVLGLTTGGPRLPDVPSADRIREGLSSSYLSIDSVLAAFALVGWLIWIYIVAVTLLRLVANVATRFALPGADGLVRLSDKVTPFVLRRILDLALGGALLVSTVGGPRVAAASQLPATPQVVQTIAISGNGHVKSAQVEVRNPQEQQRLYMVRPGDSLWKIAERELGSGLRWREIYDLNAGKDQPDGRKLREPRLIRPGWRFILPTVLSFEDESASTAPPVEPAQVDTEVPSRSSPMPTDPEEEQTPVVVERPIKIELPNGVAVPASFAAGVLAASAIDRLRRRRRRRVGDDIPSVPPDPVARMAARAGIDPSVDVIGPQSEAVTRAWSNATEKAPTFLAAWEEPQATSFLMAEPPERIPSPVETATGQRIVFLRQGDHIRAQISGPQVPRLRRSAYAPADGVLVPIGFAGSGVLHLPLLGPPFCVSGLGSDSWIDALLTFGRMRLGDDSVEVWSQDGETSLDGSGLRAKLELEALKRRRLFAEEGVLGFTDHVLQHPDDQLPVIVVVVDSANAISDLAGILVNLGIAIIIKGDGTGSDRKVVCEELHTEVQIDGLDPIIVEPARVPGEVESLPHNLGAPDLEADGDLETPESASLITEEVADHLPLSSDKAPFTAEQIAEETARGDASRKVYCLGGFRVEREGQVQDTGWRSAALEILAALIAHPKGLSRDKLVSMIWPDSEFAEVERLFYTSVSLIRSNLRGSDDTSKIVQSSRIEDTYRLDLTQVWVDIAAFREEIRKATSSDEPERHLREALDLYQGDFLGEKYYPWAEEVREQLRDEFDDACARLAHLLEEHGDLHGALELVDRAVGHNPLSEDLCRRAMDLEAKLGRRQGVIDRFQRLKTALARELELEPSDETYELFNSLARESRVAPRS